MILLNIFYIVHCWTERTTSSLLILIYYFKLCFINNVKQYFVLLYTRLAAKPKSVISSHLPASFWLESPNPLYLV
jgi:hypothetical protein